MGQGSKRSLGMQLSKLSPNGLRLGSLRLYHDILRKGFESLSV